MSAPDISAEVVERLAASYEGDMPICAQNCGCAGVCRHRTPTTCQCAETAATLRALRAALDAAERARDEQLAARHADAAFWQEEIARLTDATGYARGVRDAAAEATHASRSRRYQNGRRRDFIDSTEQHAIDAAEEIEAAILALLPATEKEARDEC